MAHLINRLYNEWAFRQERVIRDRSNPLDIDNDEELIERFRLCRRDLFELIELFDGKMVWIYPQGAHPPGECFIPGFRGWKNKRAAQWLPIEMLADDTDKERRYNTIHSTTRSLVERCIKVFKRR